MSEPIEHDQAQERQVARVVALPQGRVPPHNLDAERSLLGGVMLDGVSFVMVADVVSGADFYRDAHRVMFEAMSSLHEDRLPIDRISVKNRMVEQGTLEAAGGEEYVDMLDKVVPTAANLEYYAKIIAEKALRRRMIEAATAICQHGYEGHGSVQEFVDDCERSVFSIRSSAHTLEEAVPTKQIVAKVFKELEDLNQRGAVITGIPSGLVALDDLTGGFQAGDLVLFAARPAMGKTSLLLDTVRAAGKDGTASAAIFEMEMSKEQLVKRFLASEGRVDSTRIRNGNLGGPDWERLASAASHVVDASVWIFDQIRTVLSVRAAARRLAAKLASTPAPLKLIGVDYLQRMQGTGEGRQTRDEMFSVISSGLKSLATELKVPVIAVSSMNREVEKRQHRKPQMSDLRECGSLEFDADTIIFVHREEEYDRNNAEVKGKADLIIGKQRNGQTGEVKVGWQGKYTSFCDLGEENDNGMRARQLQLPGREEPPPPSDKERYP